MPEYDRNDHYTPDFPPGKEGCPVVGYQSVSVSVPVEVKPFARTGKTRTVCCCDPIVTMDTSTCAGKKDGTCHFTINQMLCIEVPVNFGSVIAVGDTYVDCLGASSEAFHGHHDRNCHDRDCHDRDCHDRDCHDRDCHDRDCHDRDCHDRGFHDRDCCCEKDYCD